MENIKKRTCTKKKARKIILIVLSVLILIYVILNIIFWYKGAPERFFKYDITENGSVEVKCCSAPFFLLNVPDTIGGKPVTSIDRIFGNSLLDDGKCKYREEQQLQMFPNAFVYRSDCSHQGASSRCVEGEVQKGTRKNDEQETDNGQNLFFDLGFHSPPP